MAINDRIMSWIGGDGTLNDRINGLEGNAVSAITNPVTGGSRLSAGSASFTVQQEWLAGAVGRLQPLESFGRLSDFTVNNTGSVVAAVTGEGAIRPDCINITTPALAAQSAYLTKDLIFNQNAMNGMWLLGKWNNRVTGSSPNVTLYASQLAALGAGNRFSYVMPNELTQIVGDQAVWVDKSKWTVLDGAPAWTNNMLSFRLRVDSAAAEIRDNDFKGLLFGGAKPAVVITFDDSKASSYSIGYVEASKREIPLTHYVMPLQLNTGGYLTTAQCQEMTANGNYIGLHGFDTWHNDLSRIVSDRDALLATGLSDCKHAAVPEGNVGVGTYWTTTKAALAAAGCVTARLAAGIQTPTLRGYVDPYCLPAYPLNNTMTLVQAKAAVDAAIASGGTVFFYAHNIGGAADSTTWLTADYTALLDYINLARQKRSLDVMTIKQWWEQ